ncbi:MAG: esterase [Pseudonocardiales bacterium]|nr:esterase [Pseudonocardiales bacterium]
MIGDMLSGVDLICTQTMVVLSVLSATSLAGVIALKVRGMRWSRFLPTLLIPVLLICLTAAAGVNTYFEYLPTAGDLVQAVSGDRQWPTLEAVGRMSDSERVHRYPDGVTARMQLPADSPDGFGSTVAVTYLPPQYFTAPMARFPVVYLFHGSPGKPSDWFHGGRAASAALASARGGEPAIIVAPQMSRDWTDDPECVDGMREKVESHLVDFVIPRIDQAFRTVATRDGRVFAGMSAGGYCALNLGLRHRDLTSSIIDMSGFTEPTHTGGLRKLFGEDPDAVAQQAMQNSPALYVPVMPDAPSMRIWLDCGTSDHEVLREMTTIKPALEGHGFTVLMTTRPGSHTYEVWRPAFAEALPWSLRAD